MIQKLTVLLIVNILSFYTFLSFTFGYSEFQSASIAAETFTLLLGIVLALNSRNKAFELYESTSNWIPTYFIFLIIVGNAIIGIINLDFVFSQVDFGELERKTGFNVKRISTITGSATIFIAQTGGFFIQLFLTYFLVQIFNVKLDFIDAFKTVGFAYIGFVVASILTYSHNLLYLDYYYSIGDFNQYASTSLPYLLIGKLGEYLTLLIAVFIFCRYYNINLLTSLLIVFVPNILLLLSYEIFNKIL